MGEKAVRQLMLVKYYIGMAAAQRQIDQEPSRFTAINLLHEALEATLIACADHTNAIVPDRSTIDHYLTRIEEQIPGRVLPFRTRVLQFNRARVSAKHGLTLPSENDFRMFFEVVPEFIREAVYAVFCINLDEVSLVELVQNDEIRAHLQKAVIHSSTNRFFDALASVRKAFFLLYEKDYDVSVYVGTVDGERYGIFDPRATCRAPAYARSARYVNESVRDPFDYIVLDHARVDAKSLKLGIDTHMVWNVWRLTPRVWRRPTGEWLVKHDVDIFENPNIEKDFRYALDSTIAIALQIQSRRSLERYRHSALRSIRVRPEIPFYRKASTGSEVVATLPKGVDRVNVMDAVQGLDTDDWFWSASYIRKGGPFLSGFISASDTEGGLLEGVNPLDVLHDDDDGQGNTPPAAI